MVGSGALDEMSDGTIYSTDATGNDVNESREAA
jgi:hypothetical protein